ncbi:hypothetical protein CS0771_25880 [Catellatospora sp. IY07-71]|uniref:hypothetical protein n=1 Tax=Catellatospora sp. IY07-71 TaxID=2728827 RepID=UPI001BB37943|nr:hypothetical protein [Catellatospora sp. IY07-71]BCJ73044.1 hypothetical protein CS0771_25880 [Catellatospora sp. IY07-71]
MRRFTLPLALTAVLFAAAACGTPADTTEAQATPSAAAAATSAAPAPSPSPTGSKYQVVCDGLKTQVLEVFTVSGAYDGLVKGVYQGGDAGKKAALAELKKALTDYRDALAAIVDGTTDDTLGKAAKADVAKVNGWLADLKAAGTDYDGKAAKSAGKILTGVLGGSAVLGLCKA